MKKHFVKAFLISVFFACLVTTGARAMMTEGQLLAFFVSVFLTCLMVTKAQAAMSDEEFLELCAKASSEEVKAALDGGAYVCAKDVEGNGPLMMAMRHPERKAIIQLLLEYGAITKENENVALLKSAIDHADVELIQIVLKKIWVMSGMFKVETRKHEFKRLDGTKDYDTEKYYHFENLIVDKKLGLSILGDAVSHGADVNVLDAFFNVFDDLAYRLRNHFFEDIFEAYVAGSVRFLDFAAGIAAAAMKGDLDVMMMLVKRVYTAYDKACRRFNRDARIDDFDVREATFADPRNRLNRSVILVGKGVASAETPLTFALMNENWECAKALIEAGAEMYRSSWRALLEKGLAGLNQMLDVLKFDRQVAEDDPENASSEKSYSSTPLMLAVQYAKDPKVIEMLLDSGADVNATVSDSGEKAVDFARERRDLAGTEVLKRLVRESR